MVVPTDYGGGTDMDQFNWNFADLNTGVREWVGLLVYRRSDRTETFFPQGSE